MKVCYCPVENNCLLRHQKFESRFDGRLRSLKSWKAGSGTLFVNNVVIVRTLHCLTADLAQIRITFLTHK